jgi:predicted nuclease with TOPRIM domain
MSALIESEVYRLISQVRALRARMEKLEKEHMKLVEMFARASTQAALSELPERLGEGAPEVHIWWDKGNQ